MTARETLVTDGAEALGLASRPSMKERISTKKEGVCSDVGKFLEATLRLGPRLRLRLSALPCLALHDLLVIDGLYID